MTNSNLQAEFQAKIVSLFLELADVQLRQLLNLSQLSVGLSAGESALIIDCGSKPDVEVLWSKKAWYLALPSEILGIKRILIRHRQKTAYTFSVGLILGTMNRGG